MRVEAFGCEYDGGLLSYSMPQGDKRGSDFELFDWTYDEDWGTNDNGVFFHTEKWPRLLGGWKSWTIRL